MLFKLLVSALAASAVLALTAVSASAEEPVIVHNPGEFEITSEVDMALVLDHPTLGHIPQIQCASHVLATVDGDGNIHADPADIDISSHLGSTGACDDAEACTSATPPSVAEWGGAIEEEVD